MAVTPCTPREYIPNKSTVKCDDVNWVIYYFLTIDNVILPLVYNIKFSACDLPGIICKKVLYVIIIL